MPRAPIAEISRVPAVIAPSNTPREALRIGQEGLAPLGIAISQAEHSAQSRLLIEATTAFTRAMNDYEQAVPDMNPDDIVSGFEGVVQREKQRIAEEVLRGDGRLMEIFEVRTLQAAENRRARLGLRQQARLNDAELAAVEANAIEAQRAMLLSPGPDAQEEWEAWEDSVRASGLTEVQKGRVLRAGNRSVDLNAAARLIETNPDAFLATSDTPAEFDAGYPHLLPEDRIPLRQKAEARKRKLLENATMANKAEIEAQSNEFIARIFDSEDPRGVPTISEIVASDLPRTAKEKYAALVEKANSGADLNKPNQALTNDLWRRVALPEDDPDAITDPSQLIPFLGEGLSRPDLGTLERRILERKEPSLKRIDDLKAALIKSGMKRIDHSTLMGPDPEGARRAYEFRQEFDRLWAAGLERGIDPMQMLDPSDKEYLGSIIPQFEGNFEDLVESQMKMIGIEPRQATPNVEPRQPGETPNQWKQRTGR